MKKIFCSVISMIMIISLLLTGCGPSDNASDFEYEENSDGGITITKYIGTDTKVVIPEKINGVAVTNIGELSFANSQELESVSIPSGVKNIGAAAFYRLSNLLTVNLPDGLESIDNGAFEGCSAIADLKFPTTLSSIGYAAFKDCSSLKNINIPKSLKFLGEQSFANSGIETVTFENGLESISANAFAVTKLKMIDLPDSIKSIGMNAFGGCVDLESVVLNEGLKTIESMAFSGKSKLTEIVIPSTVTEITEDVFEQCATLKCVKFEGNAPSNYTVEGDLRELMLFADYVIYFHDGAKGFTSPEWCGYKAEKW